MIISYKYKYIFIGLPFSASSAISKELLEHYDGEALLAKHSNIPLLKSERSDINLKEYYVFAVYRNPVEICFSVYNKFLTNAYGVFTDSKYFIENGGHVTKRAREKYEIVQNEKLSFEDFLIRYYSKLPYDNFLSLNKDYLKGIIYFDRLNEGFLECLKEIGIGAKRDLPLHNTTKKEIESYTLSPILDERLFYSFRYHNRKWTEQKFIARYRLQYLFYKMINFYRHRNWINRDSKYFKRRVNKSMVD